MSADAIEITTDLPFTEGPGRVIRFFPEYSAPHPLWFDFGSPQLADLQLPEVLAGRLHRWSAYWESTFQWDTGWPAGAPERWWSDEEHRLPRDVALALGRDFVVATDGGYLRSTTAAESPAAAAALLALIDADAEDRERIRADIDAGARYGFVAGGTSSTARLAARERETTPDE